ncbi:MAG TPA: septal ring lytic transglycosylase RlpA family protein [Aliidongia sp.]|nr:septal ring lytic transglycosylase RlpA family protein [Aliidongia sp.]
MASVRHRSCLLLSVLAFLSGCSALGPGGAERPVFTQLGVASWYGRHHHGHRTASGERFDMHALTAAHRTLAFDTVVRVTRLDTGKVVTVRINDRGPYERDRVIDLSAAAARALGIVEDGEAEVRIEEFRSDQPEGGRSTVATR